MKRISVYVPQCAGIESISPPYRLFRAANDFLSASGAEPLFDVQYVGLEKIIRTNDGEYQVKVDKLVSEVKQTDLVIIPAIYGPIADAVCANSAAIAWMQQLYDNGTELASLCIGSFLLGATGAVDGKKCSTHWAYINEFRETYPKVNVVEDAIISDGGNVYSSGGANSSWNLLLYLLEKYTDRHTTLLTAKYFAIDLDRDNQGVFAIFRGQKNHTDQAILKAQHYIEQNYTHKLTIEELASRINLSRRSFERRFKQATHNTVVEYTQRVKIEAAKISLEMPGKNVTEAMNDAGYTDAKTFRAVFKRCTGLSPAAYRKKYTGSFAAKRQNQGLASKT